MRRLNNVSVRRLEARKAGGSEHEAYKVDYRDVAVMAVMMVGAAPAMADDDECYWYWDNYYGWYVACDNDDWYDDDWDDD